ncbi:MAG: FHA domain-containing protein [Planctomycetota bacterium]
MLILTVIEGPDRGKTFTLPNDEPQLLGRSSEALPTGDKTVSRRHAELTPDTGRWFIRDLGSHNGTYVNGVRIAERTALAHGDQIRVGSTVVAMGGDVAPRADDAIELVGSNRLDAEIERTLASNEDSVLMASPEPRTAAVDHLRVVYRLTSLLTRASDTDQLLAAVMELVFAEFEPERGVIMMVEQTPDGPRPRPTVVRHKHPAAGTTEAGGDRPAAVDNRSPDDLKIQVSRTILKHAIDHGEGVLSSNAMNDPRFRAGDSVQRFGIRSALCSPIRFRDETFGAIYIDSSIANYTFTEEQLALLNALGQHTGLGIANLRLTAEKIQTERLAAIGETIASLSHSIKNILQGLRGGADVLEMGLRKSDLKLVAGGWDILKRNISRIMALTQNMLAYSRQRTIDIELTKLSPLLDDCASLLEDACRKKGVVLLIDADQDMPPVPVDPHLMHQALLNLMTNAVEAVEPKSGVVTVRTLFHPAGFGPDEEQPERADTFGSVFGPGPEVEVTVIDNGPGVPAERREWIFEPFHTSKGIRGTGLGLAVTRRVIEEHRGRIEVGSVADDPQTPGETGALFRVVLPADPHKIMDPSATTAAGRGLTGGDSSLMGAAFSPPREKL